MHSEQVFHISQFINKLNIDSFFWNLQKWILKFHSNGVKNFEFVDYNILQIFSWPTVNNKKNTYPMFFNLTLSRISPEPLELQKIYLNLFILVFKELSAETRHFSNLMTQSADIGKNVKNYHTTSSNQTRCVCCILMN